MIGFASLLSACEDKPKVTTAAASAAASTEQPEAAAEPTPSPPDLDLAALRSKLGCAVQKGKKPQKGGKGSCRLLEGFESAKRWDGRTPSGVGKYIGRGFHVLKGVETEEMFVLRVKTVPTAEVGPGEMPIKVGFDPLPDEHKLHGNKLVIALASGGVAGKRNQTLPYVEAYEPKKKEWGAVTTKGASVELFGELSDDDIFVRKEGTKKLYFLRVAKGRTAADGDGTYAEFYLASW
jgi:hypothetical protein